MKIGNILPYNAHSPTGLTIIVAQFAYAAHLLGLLESLRIIPDVVPQKIV